MSARRLQRLADRDGIRVHSAERIFGARSGWLVRLTLSARKFAELGASPDEPLCIAEWPCVGARSRPGAGDVLLEWFATLVGRGPERVPPEVGTALNDDLRYLLGDTYGEYKRASGF
ncbi:hypothetical protein BTM25_04190 [Actinomadura rubteroloni]|uniref:Uncharacterized protein n=1 Tax=Actinomadura rubteroloni TaxID=1926885 RepID=A0A2P4ULW5_9ACTN|nr:hypothetical protein BTM25_04190 [Actinomadura rubteroloni]